MEEQEEGVNEDQIAQDPIEDVNQDQEVVQSDVESSVPLDEEPTPAQGDETQPTVDAVDENGVPWRNRAMEIERKLQETNSFYANNLEKMVSEAITKAQGKTQTKEELPIAKQIAQYRQFAQENPDHSAWADEQIELLRDKQLEEKLTSVREKERREIESQRLAQESQERVLTNPAFADAFVTDSQGNKQLNYSSNLTKLAQGYMSDPRVKGQPDASEIAFKLAYADIAMSSQGQVAQKVQSMQRQNAQLKQATLVEGKGVTPQKAPVSDYQKAKEYLRQNPGSKEARRDAVKEYLKQTGIL